ncbi:hypothetical protein IU487_33340 [Nocardia puris]|uniref:hypothetical protein n=1 Tax=Nocardia puris TaxID=208602 RepID=UPI001894FE35|nr:hypothetical protein [Nocardia puris]MBF6215884.1 hypothetical protein [Nocardia puris]
MASNAQRRAARDRVTAYHEAQLGELIAHVEQAVRRFRAGELDAFEVDAVIHRYHRAAQKLWVFCDQSGAHVETTAHLIDHLDESGEPIDWWQRARPTRE